jgi:hypothetical protein
LKTGALETSLPTAPTNFQATLQPDGDVALHWDAATDNIGVCGYYVYRNGTMICKKQVPVHENREAGKSSLTSLTDFYLLPKTNYAYEVKAYDFANNLSPSTPVIIIKTGENPLLPNNVSVGCFYTTSIPDNFETPGQRKTKLTDGIYADSASIGDAAWEGFHDSNQKPREVVIDLGRVTPVQQFIADFLSQPKVMVYLPAEVSVSVSKDSTVFTEVGKFHNPNCPRNDSAVAFKYRMTLPAPIDARYVKFITRPADRWFDEITYEDEFEVRNNETDNKK